MSRDHVKVLFSRDYRLENEEFFFEFENAMKAQSQSYGTTESESRKEQTEIEIEKIKNKYESIQYIENKTAYQKFIKMAKYADDIAKAMGWYVAAETYNEHTGVIVFMAEVVNFLGLEDERIKFESLLGMADEYYIINNKHDPNLIEIEMHVEVCCTVTDQN